MFDNTNKHTEPRGTSPLLADVKREAAAKVAAKDAAKAERAELGWMAETP